MCSASFPLERGDDVADVNATAQHVVGVAGAGFNPGHDPPLFVPRLGRVVGLGKTAQHPVLVHGTADPDIIGGRFDQSIEYDIAGKAENVVHAVVLAPRHCLLSAVMAVTANGDVGLGPVSVDASNQAAEKACAPPCPLGSCRGAGS